MSVRFSARAIRLLRILREPSYRQALRHGVAAAAEHESIPLRSDFATVIDAGANRGQFALFAARRFPAARLLCFEPLDGPRQRLERVLASQSNLRVYPLALGDVDAPAEFHVSTADDSSSLLPIGPRQREVFGTATRGTQEVEVRRLDSVLTTTELHGPILLKIDVQGGEVGVLRGSAGILTCVDAILVEASFVELYSGQGLVDDVWRLLIDEGFVSRGAWGITYGRNGECLQADLLFSRPEFSPYPSL
jgi:FkbM family methyltransferase